MQRTQHYETTRHTGMASDVETWLANSLALILSSLAIAGAVIGWFVAMGYITHASSLTDFEGAMAWMVPSIVLGICANVFRREHHIKEMDDSFADRPVNRTMREQ
jgi:fatty acid desaturase